MMNRIDESWTSAADGSYTKTIHISGVILRVVTNPGATAPSDNYDMTLVDDHGVDLFGGQGMNRDTANSEPFCPGCPLGDGTTTSVLPVAYKGSATLTIANAGNAKQGAVSIFYR